MTGETILRNLARDRAVVELCEGGSLRLDHDYRLEVEPPPEGSDLEPRAYMVCVWCRAVRCGQADQLNACIEPWHHEPRPHRDATGTRWPIGGTRPGSDDQ